MLDGRLHRLVLVFTMVPVLIVGAVSLRQAPGPSTAALAPDAFDPDAARADLARMKLIKQRQPGSVGDDAAAAYVAGRFRAAGLRVWLERRVSATVRGQRTTTVVHASQTGFSQRKVYVTADRAWPGPGEAPLSGTAVMLEMARDIAGRTVSHTVEFISTGAGPGGALAGWSPPAEETVAVIVLGNQSATSMKRPFAVPWAESRSVAAPLSLERSAAAAIRLETGLDPGMPSSWERLARLAMPLSTTDQSALLADGVPAVSIGSSGERAIPSDGIVADGFGAFGRSALRLAGILDGVSGSWPGPPTGDVPVRDRILPEWVLTLVGGVMIAVAAIVAVDGVARSRRRRIPVLPAIKWFAAGWAGPLMMWLWLLIAGVTGLIAGVPASLAPAGAVPISWATLAGLPVAAALGWLFLRPRGMPRDSGLVPPGEVELPGQAAPAVLMLLASAATAAVWTVAPVTALLALPFLHVAPWMVDRLRPWRRRPRALILALTVLPVLLLLFLLGGAFGMGPAGILWALVLQFSGGGAVGILGSFVTTFMAGLFAGAVVLVRRGPTAGPEQFVTRGPITYAGPGSLGGTESVLRKR